MSAAPSTRDERICGAVVITDVLSERTYHGTLPNGKRVLAFYPRGRVGTALTAGDRVIIELSLFDFSEGEIVEVVALCSGAVRGSKTEP
jgi:translation initiation factor IF-1